MNDLTAQRVAANVRAELARQRITQTQLAAALRIAQSAVSRRLLGSVAFSLGELIEVARFLKVPVRTLLPEIHEGAA